MPNTSTLSINIPTIVPLSKFDFNIIYSKITHKKNMFFKPVHYFPPQSLVSFPPAEQSVQQSAPPTSETP